MQNRYFSAIFNEVREIGQINFPDLFQFYLNVREGICLVI